MHLIKDTPNFDVPFGLSLCDLFPAIRTETSVAQLVNVRPSEFEGKPVRSHSIDVCFDFPLIREAVALNTRRTEH